MFKPCNRCGYFKADGDVDMLAEERPACIVEECPVNARTDTKEVGRSRGTTATFLGRYYDELLDEGFSHDESFTLVRDAQTQSQAITLDKASGEDRTGSKYCRPVDENTLLAARIVVLTSALRDIRDNWDCDEDAHKKGMRCRCCVAAEALAKGDEIDE